MGSQLLRDMRQWVSGVMVIVFTLTSVWPSYVVQRQIGTA